MSLVLRSWSCLGIPSLAFTRPQSLVRIAIRRQFFSAQTDFKRMNSAPHVMSVTFLGTSSGGNPVLYNLLGPDWWGIGGPTDARNCSSLVLQALPDGSLWSESLFEVDTIRHSTYDNQCLIVQKVQFVNLPCKRRQDISGYGPGE